MFTVFCMEIHVTICKATNEFTQAIHTCMYLASSLMTKEAMSLKLNQRIKKKINNINTVFNQKNKLFWSSDKANLPKYNIILNSR